MVINNKQTTILAVDVDHLGGCISIVLQDNLFIALEGSQEQKRISVHKFNLGIY